MSSAATTLITGNTYPVKDQLRALGGQWDANAKGWRVPTSAAAKAQALVAGAPKQAPRNGNRPRVGYRGNGGFAGHRGRRTGCRCGSIEDEPRDSDCDNCVHDY